MRNKLFWIVTGLVFFILMVLAVATYDPAKDTIDTQKFIRKMQQENNPSPDKKQEARKSVFPKLKE